jgi:predicted PurR-regulated permease PerM
MPKKIEISHRTIVVAAVTVLLFWLVFKIWDLILLLFISVIIMSALKPAVDLLERTRIPRSVAIIIVYVLLWIFLGLVFAGIIPPLVEQTRKLVNLIPSALNNIRYLDIHQQEITTQIISGIGSLPENVFRITSGIFGNVLNVITTVVISFYLLLERKHLDQYLADFLGTKTSPRISKLISEIETKLGSWVRGELILMTVIGVATYIGLRLLGLDTALPLAILAGMLEVIPNIGPTVSAIPAVIIALLIHPLLALSTVALYILIQSLENNFLVPQVMRKTTGVNPLVSILGLMIGFRLAGIAGAILAIPTILVIQAIGLHFFSLSHLEKISDTD